MPISRCEEQDVTLGLEFRVFHWLLAQAPPTLVNVTFLMYDQCMNSCVG